MKYLILLITLLSPCCVFALDIPIKLNDKNDLISVWTSGDTSYTVLIDTGSSHSILSKKISSKFGLKVSNHGGTISSYSSESTDFEQYNGKIPFQGIGASWGKWLVLDLDKMQRNSDIDAVIGMDFLSSTNAIIDLNQMLIKLQ